MSGATAIKRAKGLSHIVRPKFGPGMLLQHEDLDQLSTYARDLNRLMFKHLFGCGVVCGLTVEEGEEICNVPHILVHGGLAITCSGDPVYVPKAIKVPLTEDCDEKVDFPLWVVLCRTTRCCIPRTSMCADDDETEPTCSREYEGFEIKVVEDVTGICRCAGGYEATRYECRCADPTDPCYQKHYAGECGCMCGTDERKCDCNCLVLAKLELTKEELAIDHSVRRFVRPLLMQDPVAYPPTEDSDGSDETETQSFELQAAATPQAPRGRRPRRPHASS